MTNAMGVLEIYQISHGSTQVHGPTQPRPTQPETARSARESSAVQGQDGPTRNIARTERGIISRRSSGTVARGTAASAWIREHSAAKPGPMRERQVP